MSCIQHLVCSLLKRFFFVSSKNKLYLDNQIPSTLDLLETEPPLSEALDLNFHTPPKGSNYAKVTVLDLMRDNSAYLEGECVTLVAVVMEVCILSKLSHFIKFKLVSTFRLELFWIARAAIANADRKSSSWIDRPRKCTFR